MVAAAAAILLLSAFPAKAQEGRPATPDPQTGIRKPANDTARDGRVRGDVDGIPAGHFRILGEAARKQHEADSTALIALRAANNALEAGPDRKEALLQKAALDSTKVAAREAEADTLLLTLQKIADGVSAVPYQVTAETTPATGSTGSSSRRSRTGCSPPRAAAWPSSAMPSWRPSSSGS